MRTSLVLGRSPTVIYVDVAVERCDALAIGGHSNVNQTNSPVDLVAELARCSRSPTFHFLERCPPLAITMSTNF
jgi:hypothetical protein